MAKGKVGDDVQAPRFHFFCGKGGVGKTSSAVSFALRLSELGRRVLLIDYDGGHSVLGTLGSAAAKSQEKNLAHQVSKNLHVRVIDGYEYEGIGAYKSKGGNFKTYFAQFPEDLGILPFVDMVTEFFGVPGDVSTLDKFALLVKLVHRNDFYCFQHVIVDVEPTAGFKSFLVGAHKTARSLKNLSEKDRLSLLGFVTKQWAPDIWAYLQTPYIKNGPEYGRRILGVVDLIREANYYLVATPEAGPIGQMEQVRAIVEEFGGTVSGYVVNNIRGAAEELKHICKIEALGLPVAEVRHMHELHNELGPPREEILSYIGGILVDKLLGKK